MNIKRWLVATTLLLIIITGLGFLKFSQIQAAMAFAATFPEPSASVKSVVVEKSPFKKSIKVIGQLQATQTLTLSNEYAGVITFVGYQPGDIVKQDQVLFKLDDSVEQANLKAAQAKLVLANKSLQRLTTLLKHDRISQDEVDRAEADVAISKADVENLNTVIRKKVIRAPFTGRTDLTPYQVGQLIDVNSQLAALVGIEDSIWVNFSVPQTMPQLAIGDEIEVSLATTKTETSHWIAKVIAKHAEIDENSRQQQYRAELTNTESTFIHNQIVNVYVPLTHGDFVMVPTNAITRDHFGHYVFQLIEDEQGNYRAKSIKVKLGDKVNNLQVVYSGLTGNELIAHEGAFKLKEGMLVYTETPVLVASNGVK